VAAQRGFIGFVVRRKGCGRGEVGVCVSEIIMVEQDREAGGWRVPSRSAQAGHAR